MTTTYEYTPAGERSEIDYEDPATHDVSYRYDPDGRQTAMVDATGQSTFSYDSLGRLTSVTDADAKTVRYGYDLADRQTTFAYPRASEITRTYAAADRLLQNTTSHEYDGRRGGDPEGQATLLKALLDDEDSAFERGELIFGAIYDGYRSPPEASGAR